MVGLAGLVRFEFGLQLLQGLPSVPAALVESLGLDVVVQLHNMGFVDKSSGGSNGANPHATVSVPSEVHTQGPYFGCNLESDAYASAADQLRGRGAHWG